MLFSRQWNEETLEEAYSGLIEDLPLNPGAPGGMIQYRRSLTLRYFLNFLQNKSHYSMLTFISHM